MTSKRIVPNSKLTVELTAHAVGWPYRTHICRAGVCAVRCCRGHGSACAVVAWRHRGCAGTRRRDSNHTDDPKLERRLSKLFDKLQRFLDEYDDHSEDW